MKFLVHVSLPPQKFNDAVRDGSAGKKIARILEATKPEAVYFAAKDGQRGGYFVHNIKDSSELPKIAEPWFLNFDATVEFMPVMLPEDLKAANLEKLGKKWG